jgi:hypothetical protein
MAESVTKEASVSALLDLVRIEEIVRLSMSKRTLLAIAELLNNPWQYTTKEYREAVAILAKYHLASLVNLSSPLRSREMIEKERATPYDRRCAMCGLIITAEKSLQAGYGSVCRRKVDASMCHVAQTHPTQAENYSWRIEKGGDGNG